MTAIEIHPLSIDQRIEQRADELCPSWQRPNRKLEAWASAQARSEIMRATCDFGSCHDPAESFEQTIRGGMIIETRPFCAEHALLSLQLRAYAAQERGYTTREDGDSFGPNLRPGKPDAS